MCFAGACQSWPTTISGKYRPTTFHRNRSVKSGWCDSLVPRSSASSSIGRSLQGMLHDTGAPCRARWGKLRRTITQRTTGDYCVWSPQQELLGGIRWRIKRSQWLQGPYRKPEEIASILFFCQNNCFRVCVDGLCAWVWDLFEIIQNSLKRLHLMRCCPSSYQHLTWFKWVLHSYKPVRECKTNLTRA